MNVLSDEKRTAILSALVEGNSLRATARMSGTALNTVSSLLKLMGAHCKNYHDRFVVDLEPKRVQADEIWAFCGAKQKNATQEGHGDIWTWTALDQDSKLLISYRVGARDVETASAFMQDLKDRLTRRVQLSTDGYTVYLKAVEQAFGWGRVDYAQLVKIYSFHHTGRYTPPECIGARKERIMGKPKKADVCTSHVERQNLTMRMNMRRFTRLTNAFSKKAEFHMYAVALHTMHYNFCRAHTTLTKAAKGFKTTPAMVARLAERPWTMADLLKLLHGE